MLITKTSRLSLKQCLTDKLLLLPESPTLSIISTRFYALLIDSTLQFSVVLSLVPKVLVIVIIQLRCDHLRLKVYDTRYDFDGIVLVLPHHYEFYGRMDMFSILRCCKQFCRGFLAHSYKHSSINVCWLSTRICSGLPLPDDR